MGEGLVFASLFYNTVRLTGNNGNRNTQRIEIFCAAERLQQSNTAMKYTDLQYQLFLARVKNN